MRFVEVRPLTLTQFACMANVLLEAGNLSANLVVTALHRPYAIALFRMKGALLFNRRFSGTLISEGRLHRKLSLTHRTVVNFRTAVEITQPQREQLGGQPALLLLESL